MGWKCKETVMPNILLMKKMFIFDLDKNTCTKSRILAITFIQKRSNKRIMLTVTQSAVICDVGDVYCYDTSNGNYYFVDVLNGDTIDGSLLDLLVLRLYQWIMVLMRMENLLVSFL